MSLNLLPFRLICLVLVMFGTVSLTWAQVDPNMCGDVKGAHGDYRTATQALRDEVDTAHYTSKVENLIAGNTGPLGADIAYTLRAFPNHHRALASVMRWSERIKTTSLPNMPFPAECYFERGIRFKPDDHVVRLLYAQFLNGQARPVEAAKQLEYVARIGSDNGFTMYNIGLIYSDMKDNAQALAFAHKAMALGFSRPELRQRLERVGRWVEPQAEGAKSPTTAASAPSPVSAASAPAPQTD